MRLATHEGHVTLPFKLHEHSSKFVGWQVKGSRLVREEGQLFLHVTFRKVVEERDAEGILGIDINERSIDLAVAKQDRRRLIKIDISEAKYIRDRYFKKRRSIQRKASQSTKAKLLQKYSKRERRRVDAILHKASKIIAYITAREKVKPVMEDLKNIRDRIRYTRVMSRRLHNLSFRKTQSYIYYKSMEQGLKPETVEAKNTSKTCPICGEINKPNGHVFKCKRCGLQADRHLVAAWNIAAKLPMCRPSPLAAKAIDEALKAEMERIVIKY